jgi:hypothetical protein
VTYGKQQSGNEQGAGSFEDCVDSEGVKLQRESTSSEGESMV